MAGHRLCLLSAIIFLFYACEAHADFGAGQRALEAGRVSEALDHWRLAADTGDVRAMLALGRLYQYGLGVPQDYALAQRWFRRAANQGSAEAIAELDALAEKLTPAPGFPTEEQAPFGPPGTSPAIDTQDAGDGQTAGGELSLAAHREAQELLSALGYDPGPADGKWGMRTVHAYQSFLRDTGQSASEALTLGALRTLRTMAAIERGGADPVFAKSAPSKATVTVASRASVPGAALHDMVLSGDTDGVRAAVNAGADLNSQDQRGWTALMYAADRGNTQLVDALLDAGTDPDIRAEDGATALFVAVMQGREEVARTLVRAEADLSITGPGGKTPLEVAQFHELRRTVALLTVAGADRAGFAAAQRSNSSQAYVRYMRDYPDGMFVERAEVLRDEALDREAFGQAQANNTARAHRAYLTAFPEGKHREEAEAFVIQLDSEEFHQADRAQTSAAYEAYRRANPEGLFREEAERKGRIALDNEQFTEARRLDTIAGWNHYLSAQPDGAHRMDAEKRIKALREPIVFAQAKEAHTVEAYIRYLTTYPEGRFTDAANREKARLEVIGTEFEDCDYCPTMVVIPPGSFVMGSNRGEAVEFPRHQVTIANPIAVGKFEVTVAEFKAFVLETAHDMGEEEGLFGLPTSESCFSRRILQVFEKLSWRDPGFSQADASPVVCVSWNDAVAYVKWLSMKTEQSYRLLSESEWEYAARATTQTAFHFGDIISTKEANYNGAHNDGFSVDRGDRGGAIEVGSFPPNRFGLHDLHGNALEWVEDCWHENYDGAPTDGQAWTSGGNCSMRVTRGGSWFNFAPLLRSAYRSPVDVRERYTHYGFRVARPIDPVAVLSRGTSGSAVRANR